MIALNTPYLQERPRGNIVPTQMIFYYSKKDKLHILYNNQVPTNPLKPPLTHHYIVLPPNQVKMYIQWYLYCVMVIEYSQPIE